MHYNISLLPEKEINCISYLFFTESNALCCVTFSHLGWDDVDIGLGWDDDIMFLRKKKNSLFLANVKALSHQK